MTGEDRELWDELEARYPALLDPMPYNDWPPGGSVELEKRPGQSANAFSEQVSELIRRASEQDASAYRFIRNAVRHYVGG